MQIKDYRCKCGCNDFFFIDKCNQKGIYCTDCGRWFKWADKDEQNLAMKQEPTTQERQAESDKFDAAFQDGYNNGYAQARFDYEHEISVLQNRCYALSRSL